jgi:nitronate monooxygenase
MKAAAADVLIAEVTSGTNRPVNVNVFVHAPPRRDPAREQAWLAALSPLFAELGAEPPVELNEIYRSFDDDDEMLAVLLARRPAVVSFHFGIPRASRIEALKRGGAILLATATTPVEARRIEAAGIDVVITQGHEAGGHQGVFEVGARDTIGTLALVPQVAAAVEIPVVAAGGIATGAGVVSALALGADGAQMGTAFVSCPESSASDAHRGYLAGGELVETALTSAVSGRPARGIVNRLIEEFRGRDGAAPDYPVAYDAGKALAAASGGSPDYAAMWTGQSAALSRALPSGELVDVLCKEIGVELARLNALAGTPQR